MMKNDDDILWQARNADLEGRYREAEQLRKQWCEANQSICPACGNTYYPGYHDKTECADQLLRPIMEE